MSHLHIPLNEIAASQKRPSVPASRCTLGTAMRWRSVILSARLKSTRCLERALPMVPLTCTLCHRLLPARASTQACFWDGDKLEQRKSFSQEWKVESASFCPGRGRFVVGGEDMYAHLYEYSTGNELECNRGAQPAQHRALAAQSVCV